MKTFAFGITIDAVVRVQAVDEENARTVVPTVLGAPSMAEIRMANENTSGLGIDAVIEDVEFNAAPWACSKSTASASSAAGGDWCRRRTFASSSAGHCG
jgi:hypothetical protein